MHKICSETSFRCSTDQQIRPASAEYSCIGAWKKSAQVLFTKGSVMVEAAQLMVYPPTAAGEGT